MEVWGGVRESMRFRRLGGKEVELLRLGGGQDALD